jgi:RHS repeat-associated protein
MAVSRPQVARASPPARFQSSWCDGTTGLYWVVTRWYDPTLGRFVSEDSLLGEPRNPDSSNRYAYGEGDPVNHWDPDGREAACPPVANPVWRAGCEAGSIALRLLAWGATAIATMVLTRELTSASMS